MPRLEPCAAKAASTVLRGRRCSNVLLLPDYHHELKDIIEKLDSARDELNKKIRIERNKSFYVIIGTVVAVLSVIIALVAYLGCR